MRTGQPRRQLQPLVQCLTGKTMRSGNRWWFRQPRMLRGLPNDPSGRRLGLRCSPAVRMPKVEPSPMRLHPVSHSSKTLNPTDQPILGWCRQHRRLGLPKQPANRGIRIQRVGRPTGKGTGSSQKNQRWYSRRLQLRFGRSSRPWLNLHLACIQQQRSDPTVPKPMAPRSEPTCLSHRLQRKE